MPLCNASEVHEAYEVSRLPGSRGIRNVRTEFAEHY
jgi:hypothetical protein